LEDNWPFNDGALFGYASPPGRKSYWCRSRKIRQENPPKSSTVSYLENLAIELNKQELNHLFLATAQSSPQRSEVFLLGVFSVW